MEFATAKTLELFLVFGVAIAWAVRELVVLDRRRAAREAEALARGPYRPPAPVPTSETRALVRFVLTGERDLLGLLPADAYRRKAMWLGKSRRGILIVNDPAAVTAVLTDPEGLFPKNDLMVGALTGLVGNSLFVASGEPWRRQRRMIEPAFSHMRIDRAFAAMSAGVEAYERVLDGHAREGAAFSLDAAMGHVTADIICRTIFSTSLESRTARDVFHAFLEFERSCANVDLKRLLLDKPFADIPQPANVQAACRLIRTRIGGMLDQRIAAGDQDDIVKAVLDARDPDTGEGFTREEMIDQLGVFFLAGHETSASVLTWAFFMLSQQPDAVARMRAEIDAVAGSGAIAVEHVKRLAFVRNVFREAARLYPPITFIPRVAMRSTRVAGYAVSRGTMIMIAPWTIHRHTGLWENADRFDPDRFAAEREAGVPPGAYIPFGLGPRICVGAAFATIEATLILARLVRRYDIAAIDPASVRPVARLTARPKTEIMCRVRRREAAPAEREPARASAA